jgi:hypothetical protein
VAQFVGRCVICLGLLAGSQGRSDLPPVSRVPIEERLWTAEIVHGEAEAYPGESSQLAKACGDPSSVSGLTADVWYACRAKHISPARYRIAVLHSAPNESSPVVASVYEERRIDSSNQLAFTWTVELASHRGERLPWPDAIGAFDYGLHLAGVQRRGGWVRLLSSIPTDGWMRITSVGAEPPVYIWVSPLEGQIVDLSPLMASWPDGRRRQIEGGSYLIQSVSGAGSIEFRAEIPSDYNCGQSVTDPVPLPPALKARAAEFFDENGTPRFFTAYTKGC